MKLNGSYELHLTVREASLQAGAEWSSQFSSWLVIQIKTGTGYWIHTTQTVELEPRTILVLAPDSQGSILASQVGGLSLHYYRVEPRCLMGLLTLAEQTFFHAAACQSVLLARMMTPDQPLAVKLQELIRNRTKVGSLFRLQLLQIFVEFFGEELNQEVAGPDTNAGAKQRLSDFLKTTQTCDLINLNFSHLVDVSGCTPRHLSRIFREVVGMSFRDKQAELRLTQACDILVNTELKIVDVALESGFQSLSLFNLMFARRFGMSPGRWRQKYRENRLTGTRTPRKAAPLLASAF